MITIAIPTCSFGRFDLLADMIDSINRGTYRSANIHIVIVVDGDPRLYEAVKKRNEKFGLPNVSIILNKKRSGWVFSVNRVLKEFESEFYIYASDDLIFPHDCIENAMITMQEHFPTGFGVVSLGKKTKCIFGLIGNEWVKHFPKREVFCPYYTHYGADAEHTDFCKKIGKFTYPPKRDSQVKHFRLNDETRIFARKSRTRDLILHRNRKERGRLWGENFDE